MNTLLNSPGATPPLDPADLSEADSAETDLVDVVTRVPT